MMDPPEGPKFPLFDSAKENQKVAACTLEYDQITGSCSASTCAQKSTPEWAGTLSLLVQEYFNESSTLKRQFSTEPSNDQRLFHFITNVGVIQQLNGCFQVCKENLLVKCLCHKKNASKADQIRLVGNKAYLIRIFPLSYMLAIRFYTKGLMRAPEFCDEAALLYGNRSAAYFHAEQFENALEDIERAFKLGYARLKPTGTGKILIRKAECLVKLGRTEEAKKMFESNEILSLNEARFNELKELAKNTHVEKRDVNLFKFQETPSVIKVLAAEGKFTSHEEYPWLNTKVDLRYTAEKGFQLFAKEDLAYGEVVAIGEPVASYVNFKLGTETHRCHNCLVDLAQADGNGLGMHPEKIGLCRKLQGLSSGLSRSFAPVPCTVCPNAVFCSEACRSQAWDAFHRFECSQLYVLNSFDHQARLALRMLYSAGSWEKAKQVADYWDSHVCQPKMKTTSSQMAQFMIRMIYSRDYLEQTIQAASKGEFISDHFQMVKNPNFDMLKNPRDYAFIYGMRQDEEMDPEEAFRLMATARFLAKLATDSGFVPDNPMENQRAMGNFLFRHLCQLKANLTMPPKDISYYREEPTRVHGIANMMHKSSGKANIARFWVAQRSAFQSNAHLFYVTKPIKAGQELLIPSGNQRVEEAEKDLQFDILLASSTI